MMFGHLSRASAMLMTFLTPRSLASREQAMSQVCSAPANGTTPTGRPRNRGCTCCSTEAKKPSKSRYKRSIWAGWRMPRSREEERSIRTYSEHESQASPCAASGACFKRRRPAPARSQPQRHPPGCTTKFAFPAPGADVPGLSACELCIEELALPKSSESGNVNQQGRYPVGAGWISFRKPDQVMPVSQESEPETEPEPTVYR